MKVLKFYAPWCGQCKVLTKELEKNPINVPIESINVEDNEEMTKKYNVQGLPTLILTDKEGKVLVTWHGIIKSEVINNKIKEYGSNSDTGDSLE